MASTTSKPQDIAVDVDYFDSAPVKRLVGRLGHGADILPLRLRCYCGKHHPEDGRFDGYSVEEIESIAGWTGTPGAMVNAMAHLFLGRKDGVYFLLNWKADRDQATARRAHNT